MDYKKIPSKEIMEKTVAALKERGDEAIVVDTKEEALEKIKNLIPQGSSVMNGSSTTLNQIGFTEYLKSDDHGWNNLHKAIAAEKDSEKQMQLRQQSAFAQYFLGSVHAITEAGQTITASGSGSQIAPYAYTAPNVIWVASTNKIVPTLEHGFKRIQEYVFPLEDERMKSLGYPGSNLGKILIFENDRSPFRKITMILVNETLGF